MIRGCANQQVCIPVVQFVAVDVVYDFATSQLPAQHLLCLQYVFVLPPTLAVCDNPIAFRREPAASELPVVLAAIVCVVAVATAEKPLRLHVLLLADEHHATTLARSDPSFPAGHQNIPLFLDFPKISCQWFSTASLS